VGCQAAEEDQGRRLACAMSLNLVHKLRLTAIAVCKTVQS
jgi:hypothetical protein